ncbi:MAG: class I SAM-dependent methyltransferase [Candidatus Aminicenantes bacterium]|nr:class I SAM-dependent methyltransferase [Candidatus Aminicenantes bacterium]
MNREQRDQALFDRIASRYARKDSLASSAAVRREKLLFALAPVLEGRMDLGTIVDVGCGAGGPAAYLRGRYQRYIGIDYSRELIKEAKRIHRGNLQAEFIAGNIKAGVLPARIADLVLCDGALHHMTELDRVMNALAAVVKPGAFLVAIEPQGSNVLIAGTRWLRGVLDRSYSRDQVPFSQAGLRDLFSKVGISDVRFRWQGLFSTPLAEVPLAPQALFVPLGRFAAALDRWLQRRMPALMRRLAFNIVASGRFPV